MLRAAVFVDVLAVSAWAAAWVEVEGVRLVQALRRKARVRNGLIRIFFIHAFFRCVLRCSGKRRGSIQRVVAFGGQGG